MDQAFKVRGALALARQDQGHHGAMRVSASRTISAYALAAAFLTGLFLMVVVAQIAVVSALRGAGLGGGAALSIAGVIVLGAVLALNGAVRALRGRSQMAKEAARMRHALPDGPCCVVWRGRGEAEFPFELEGDVNVVYPSAARRLGIEGVAVVDFEIGADGVPKNPHVVDFWPSRLFYDAAVEALSQARFRPRDPAKAWRGPSYRMPFVFRLRGAARVRDAGRRTPRRGSVLWALRKLLVSLRVLKIS